MFQKTRAVLGERAHAVLEVEKVLYLSYFIVYYILLRGRGLFILILYVYIVEGYIILFVHAISLTGKLIGAGSGRVYSGCDWQPPRLAQTPLV